MGGSPARLQCEWGRPAAQPQQPPPPFMPQGGASPPLAATFEAKTDSFLLSLIDPQCGHAVPCQRVERTRISLSFRQSPQ